MRSLPFALVVAWLLSVSACGNTRPPPIGSFELDGYVPYGLDASDDLARQTFDIVPIDVPPRDTPAADAPIVIGMNCTSDEGCAFGARCLQGLCALDTCRTSDNPCGADARCDMRCVPTRDLCAGVRCNNRETCFLGRCVPGCFPAPCSGVSCPSGQYCDDSTGACAPIRPCTARCGTDYACHVQCLPRSNCDGVMCAATEICADGRCMPNPCAGVTCAPGALCVEGRCIDTCTCDPPCTRSPRDRCVVGQCQCERSCAAGGACGADDGCGGQCIGVCPGTIGRCDPLAFTCTCITTCTELSPCGSSDGCGGRCESGCPNGQQCEPATGTCRCVTDCPRAEEFGNYDCGATIPNRCAGAPACGTGTRCEMGFHCAGTRCEPDDMEDASTDEAGSCPDGRTLCDGACFNLQTNNAHCGSCGNRCPTGTNCVAGACTCPSSSLTLCGSLCVNTQGDQSNCGACGASCPMLSSCVAGRCSCVERCAIDPSLVTCGESVPNECPGGPSCGRGTRCASGSLCSAAGRCECVPLCPLGVRCGVTDGCGGTCIGACGAGETCARDPMDDTRYFCSSAGCVGGCACNEVCSMNRCVAVTCANGSSPCPCQCCPVGQRCVGGSACMPIPP